MNKEHFYPERFVESLSRSFPYTVTPVPNSLKQEFKRYDLTIFMISYKRVRNLEEILSSLTKQTSKVTIELIIWNNNPTISLKWLKEKFENKFANLVIIESSFNYYCIIRSAISSLARGEYLMFLDDDVMPYEDFIEVYMNEIDRL